MVRNNNLSSASSATRVSSWLRLYPDKSVLCTRFEHLDSVTKACQSDNVKIVKSESNIIGLALTIFYTIISLTEKEIIQVQSQLQ